MEQEGDLFLIHMILFECLILHEMQSNYLLFDVLCIILVLYWIEILIWNRIKLFLSLFVRAVKCTALVVLFNSLYHSFIIVSFEKYANNWVLIVKLLQLSGFVLSSSMLVILCSSTIKFFLVIFPICIFLSIFFISW